jgi:hypothetical protein
VQILAREVDNLLHAAAGVKTGVARHSLQMAHRDNGFLNFEYILQPAHDDFSFHRQGKTLLPVL